MMRIAAVPEVAITFAQLGIRLNNTGTMASAPWSNLFPNTVDKCLQTNNNKNIYTQQKSVQTQTYLTNHE